MSKMKAVVLEKSGLRYTVLGLDGTFRHVHRRLNAEVGEEIEIHLWAESYCGIRRWAQAVALFLLVLTGLIGWNLYQAPTAVALISIDINPSLQFSLDKQGHLLKFNIQNEDAKQMLSGIDLQGKPIEEVLEQIVTQAYNQKFLSTDQPWVVIGFSSMTNKASEQMSNQLNENQIVSWITTIGNKKGLPAQVKVFSLNSQERELAQKEDLTLGEYALWQTADKAGVVTQPEKLKDKSERMRLLANPQVQAEIKSVKKEPESGVQGTSGSEKKDQGLKVKPDKESTEKPMSDRQPPSPDKVQTNPASEKGKHQDNEKNNEKNLSQPFDKRLDQSKNSENQKLGIVKER